MAQMNWLHLGILSFAVFLHLLSVGLPYWFKNSFYNTGLWTICVRGKCKSITDTTDTFKSLQSLEVLGLFAGILGILTILIGSFTQLLRPRLTKLLIAVHCIATGVFILIGIIVWCVQTFQLSACFAMSLAASFLCGILGGRLTVSDEQ